MNDFISRFKWVLIGGGSLILVAIAVTVGVLVGVGGRPGQVENGEVPNVADIPGPETNQGGEGAGSGNGQTFEGTGTKSQTFQTGGGLTIIKLTHEGPANFVVQYGQGQDLQLLVNAIGLFAGSKAVGLPEGEYTLDISTLGDWTVLIEQSAPSSADGPPQELSGNGQVATDFFSLAEGTATFQMNHEGTGGFIATLIRSDGTPITGLANELGVFNGSKEVTVSEGIYLVDVTTKGDWTIDVSQ